MNVGWAVRITNFAGQSDSRFARGGPSDPRPVRPGPARAACQHRLDASGERRHVLQVRPPPPHEQQAGVLHQGLPPLLGHTTSRGSRSYFTLPSTSPATPNCSTVEVRRPKNRPSRSRSVPAAPAAGSRVPASRSRLTVSSGDSERGSSRCENLPSAAGSPATAAEVGDAAKLLARSGAHDAAHSRAITTASSVPCSRAVSRTARAADVRRIAVPATRCSGSIAARCRCAHLASPVNRGATVMHGWVGERPDRQFGQQSSSGVTGCGAHGECRSDRSDGHRAPGCGRLVGRQRLRRHVHATRQSREPLPVDGVVQCCGGPPGGERIWVVNTPWYSADDVGSGRGIPAAWRRRRSRGGPAVTLWASAPPVDDDLAPRTWVGTPGQPALAGQGRPCRFSLPRDGALGSAISPRWRGKAVVGAGEAGRG